MKAVTWHGPRDVRVTEVPEPRLLNPRDAIVRITTTAICGSDLHLYNGWIAGMRAGDILGHEPMGLVAEVGDEVSTVRPGQRVVVAAPISCGRCWYCREGQFSMCDNSNPNAPLAEAVFGVSTAGIYGYSHAFGGYPGGQAEYLRVPFADVGLLPVPDELTDDQAVLLADVAPTGYMAAEMASVSPGDVVAVWGCGPIGQLAIRSAQLMGAGTIIAIDRYPERLDLARAAGALTIDDRTDVVEEIKQITAGRGADSCIDAVGTEAHGQDVLAWMDRVAQPLRLATDRATALRQAIQAARKGGTISVVGVYAGLVDKVPISTFVNKGLTMRSGQVHAQRYMPQLLELVRQGTLDPAEIVTHRLPLDEAVDGYRMFNDKRDGCVKVLLRTEVAA